MATETQIETAFRLAGYPNGRPSGSSPPAGFELIAPAHWASVVGLFSNEIVDALSAIAGSDNGAEYYMAALLLEVLFAAGIAADGRPLNLTTLTIAETTRDFESFESHATATEQRVRGLRAVGKLIGQTNPTIDTSRANALAIRNLLESLMGSDRLPASAIANIPHGGTTLTAAGIVALLESLSGNQRLPYSALSGTPAPPSPALTLMQIVAGISALTGNDRIPASAIRGLPTPPATGGGQGISAMQLIGLLTGLSDTDYDSVLALLGQQSGVLKLDSQTFNNMLDPIRADEFTTEFSRNLHYYFAIRVPADANRTVLRSIWGRGTIVRLRRQALTVTLRLTGLPLIDSLETDITYGGFEYVGSPRLPDSSQSPQAGYDIEFIAPALDRLAIVPPALVGSATTIAGTGGQAGQIWGVDAAGNGGWRDTAALPNRVVELDSATNPSGTLAVNASLMSVTITPRSASSRIRLDFSGWIGKNSTTPGYIDLKLTVGSSTAEVQRLEWWDNHTNAEESLYQAMMIHSPNTTSAVTYHIRNHNAAQLLIVERSSIRPMILIAEEL